MHHSEVDDNKTLLKVVNEIVHVHETREQIEPNDQTPLLEIDPSKNGGNTQTIVLASKLPIRLITLQKFFVSHLSP